jgi:hypothetical protein
MADAWVLFDRLADSYDSVIPFFSEFATQLVELLDPPGDAKVLGGAVYLAELPR